MFDLNAIDLDKSVNDNKIDMSIVLRNLSHDAFQAALGWKLMYLTCNEPRQFWAWANEQELAFVFAERARVEEAGVALLPEWAESLNQPHTGSCAECERVGLVNAFWMCKGCVLEAAIPDSTVYGIDEFGDLYDLEPIPRFRPSEY